jgi:hypothetical protein
LTKKLSIAAELGFLKDKITVTADYYRNRSSNQLVRNNLSLQTGFQGIFENLPATIQTQGWEFTLSTLNIRSGDWKWTTNFNASLFRNKLVDFPGIENTSYAARFIVGEPINISKLYSFAGIDPATGTAQFYKADGSITNTPNSTTDNFYIYNPNPKWSGGMVSSLSWKQLSLDIAFQYVNQQGISMYSDFAQPGTFNGNSNMPAIYLDRWRTAGDNSMIQKLSTTFFYDDNANASNRSLTDRSFLRVKNVSLSYQLPRRWQHALNMTNARLFANGQNLYTFTRYKGLDPETGTFSLPQLRVISLGVQASF